MSALSAAGITDADCPGTAADFAGECWLVAWVGDSAAGVACVETVVDTAALCALAVAEPMRRRGIGAMLLAAARKAAFTRGARRLYAALPEGADYLKRLGFEDAAASRMLEDMSGTAAVSRLGGHDDSPVARDIVLMADISRDGVVER